MTRSIALALLVLPLAFGGTAYAGKFAGGNFRADPPTGFSAPIDSCDGPQHHNRNNPCAPQETTTTPTQPHGGCGYYGPNGVLIRCE